MEENTGGMRRLQRFFGGVQSRLADFLPTPLQELLQRLRPIAPLQPGIDPNRLTQTYWNERFVVPMAQLQAAEAANLTLRREYESLDLYKTEPEARSMLAMDGGGGGPYPWRQTLNPTTGLPAATRFQLHTPLEPAPTQISDLLKSPTYSQAIFGADGIFALSFPDQPDQTLTFEPPSLVAGTRDGMGSPEDAQQFQHYIWHQSFNELPVIGAGLSAHGLIGDKRLAITNAHFPVPEDQPTTPMCDEETARRLARKEVAAQILRLRPGHVFGQGLHHQNPAQPHKPPFDSVAMLQQIQTDDVKVELVRVREHDYAILPFKGQYYLIQRFHVALPTGQDWLVDIDVSTEKGAMIGQPWPASVHVPFARNMVEATGGPPSGDSASLNWPDIGQFVSIPFADRNQIWGIMAGYWAKKVRDHLVCVCGMNPSILQGNGSPRLHTTFSPGEGTQFHASVPGEPKRINLQPGDIAGNPPILAPVMDPEVVMHEFVHGFLWALRPEAWEMPDPIAPFARALQEGYAIYLARSIMVKEDPNEVNHPWARRAYAPVDWNDRWLLPRPRAEIGADRLPAPNVYPAGSYSVDGLEVYDVGMIWARTLWDLRSLLGGERVDFLAVQSYFYLHGYVANFDLAAEGMLDVDLKRMNNINLNQCAQILWGMRGVAAGQGIFTFANVNHVFYAGGDAGIMRWDAGSGHWVAENTLTVGGMLTGVRSLVAIGDVLLAAAVLPPAQLTSQTETQWQPGIFMRAAGDAAWSRWLGWSGQEFAALSPTVLCSVGATGLAVGTTQGVYFWNNVNLPNDYLTPGNTREYHIVGLSLVQTGGQKKLYAATPTNVWVLKTDWSRIPVGDFGDTSQARFICLAASSNQCYVGGVSGLGLISDTGIQRQAPQTILAVTGEQGANPALFYATDSAAFKLAGAGGAPVAQPNLPLGITVTSIHASDGMIFIGTLAHGIWRVDNAKWVRDTMPPAAPLLLTLQPGEQSLYSLEIADPGDYTIPIPAVVGQVRVMAVTQPQVFLKHVLANAGGYALEKGLVILVLQNDTPNPVTITRSVIAPGQIQLEF